MYTLTTYDKKQLAKYTSAVVQPISVSTVVPATTHFRPIAFITISQVLQANPKKTGESSTDYQKRISAAFLATADTIISIGKTMDAKAFIVWDASCDDTLPFKYLGHPKCQHANFKPVAQPWFKKIRDSGMEPGVLLRHQTPIKDAAGDLVLVQPEYYAWSLINKAYWAKTNYGINWVYVDSSVTPVGFPIDPRSLVLLNMVFPTMHWFLENVGPPPPEDHAGYNLDNFKVCGRFIDARQWPTLPHNDGFKYLIGMVGPEWNDNGARFNDLVQMIKEGHDVMYEGWWGNEMNSSIKAAFNAANAS